MERFVLFETYEANPIAIIVERKNSEEFKQALTQAIKEHFDPDDEPKIIFNSDNENLFDVDMMEEGEESSREFYLVPTAEY